MFVNYRTVDVRFGAVNAYDGLVRRFGADRVFLDQVAMSPGEVYPESIRAALDQVRVLVVLIGRAWLAEDPSTGARLIDRENDWVRREICRALERGIVIIPVLLEGAVSPRPDVLPTDIREVALRQAVPFRHRNQAADLARLTDAVARWVPEPATAGSPLPAPDPRFPADLPDFVDRVTEVREAADYALDRWPVIVIQGMGGVGKSKLAIHLAHRLRFRWPDRLLYVDLQGQDRAPVPPVEALGTLLARLDVTAEGTLRQRRDRWHAAIADQRAVLVLDNASSLAQVVPLVPADRSCLVLITSRHPIALDGAKYVDLDMFDEESARDLIEGVAGVVRPDLLAEVVGYCARLPIALRAAAVRLRRATAESVLLSLREERTRLAALRVAADELDVRASLVAGYRSMPPGLRRAFTALAVVPGTDFGVEVAAAVLGTGSAEAAATVDDLVLASVLDQAGGGRYRYHDLYRLVATEMITGKDRHAAAEAAVDWFESTVRGLAADHRADGLPRQDSLPWLDVEARNAWAAAVTATEAGLHPPAVSIANELKGYFVYRGLTEEAEHLLRTGLRSAVALGEFVPLLNTVLALADLLGDLERGAESVDLLDDLLAREMSDRHRSYVLAMKGARLREQLLHHDAVTTLEEALRLARSCEPLHLAWVLNYLGLAYEKSGRHHEALAAEAEAQRLYEDADDLPSVLWVSLYRSHTLESLRRYDEVEQSLRFALDTLAGMGQPASEASFTHRLCEFYAARGDYTRLVDAAASLRRIADRMDNDGIRAQAEEFRAHAHEGGT